MVLCYSTPNSLQVLHLKSRSDSRSVDICDPETSPSLGAHPDMSWARRGLRAVVPTRLRPGFTRSLGIMDQKPGMQVNPKIASKCFEVSGKWMFNDVHTYSYIYNIHYIYTSKYHQISQTWPQDQVSPAPRGERMPQMHPERPWRGSAFYRSQIP